MLFKADELIKALNGDTEKAQSVYEWAQKTPMAQMMSAVEVIKEYDNRFEGETQEKIEMGNYKEDDMATGFSSDAVDQVEDNTSNEAPQPIFAGYTNVKLPQPNEALLRDIHVDIEEWFEEDGVDYQYIYRKGDNYYSSDIDGGIEVILAPVNDPSLKNYYITTDGMLVRWVKSRGQYVPAGVQQSKRTYNLFISKWMRKEKKQVYYTVSAMMVRTFKERDYDNRTALVIDGENGRESVAVYNVKGLYGGDNNEH